MTEEVFKQRVERLVQERDTSALLAEAQKLLAIYVGGDDAIDLEPIISAQWILQQISEFLFSQSAQDKAFPVTSVSRSDLQELEATPEQLAVFTDQDLERIARLMGDQYVQYGGFWPDLRLAVNTVLKSRKSDKEDKQ